MELHFPLILDGATGTELQKRGYAGDVSAEQWVLAHPDSILSIQRDYVAAGSQVLYTPTFGGNAVKLAEHGVTEDTAAYNRRLADLSRQAADGKALLAGDLSPTGLFLAPLGSASFDQLVDAYAQQAAGLEAAGVDLYVIETMMTLSDARAAVLAVRSVSAKPIFVTLPATRMAAASPAPTSPPPCWYCRAWASTPSVSTARRGRTRCCPSSAACGSTPASP